MYQNIEDVVFQYDLVWYCTLLFRVFLKYGDCRLLLRISECFIRFCILLFLCKSGIPNIFTRPGLWIVTNGVALSYVVHCLLFCMSCFKARLVLLVFIHSVGWCCFIQPLLCICIRFWIVYDNQTYSSCQTERYVSFSVIRMISKIENLSTCIDACRQVYKIYQYLCISHVSRRLLLGMLVVLAVPI